MGWTVQGSNPGGGEIFHNCPDQPWDPPRLLYNGYRLFPRVKNGRGMTLTPHPLLMPWSRKGRAIPLLPHWAVWPVQSLSACAVELYLYSPIGLYGLYRASVPVQGCTLFNSKLISPLIYSFLTLWCLMFHCEHTYLLALWPTERLGLCNYGHPFFHFNCLLSPSFKLHLPYMLPHIFQPSQSRSSPSTSLWFSLKYFLN
jgi:hypothetical protein